tara:strand:- start:1292 stop:1492 length:201 start_codon:yes stop_codon:yes gene_type:complete
MKKSEFINQVQNANGYISQAIDVLEGVKMELDDSMGSEEAFEDIEHLIAELQGLEHQAENIAPHCE